MILRIRAVLAIGGVCLLAAASIYANADATPFSIDAHVISAGSSARSTSPCFRLSATIAEPVAGFSSSAGFSLSGGFRAHANVANDDTLFFSGFEACTP